jgi:hypothetical protein
MPLCSRSIFLRVLFSHLRLKKTSMAWKGQTKKRRFISYHDKQAIIGSAHVSLHFALII